MAATFNKVSHIKESSSQKTINTKARECYQLSINKNGEF